MIYEQPSLFHYHHENGLGDCHHCNILRKYNFLHFDDFFLMCLMSKIIYNLTPSPLRACSANSSSVSADRTTECLLEVTWHHGLGILLLVRLLSFLHSSNEQVECHTYKHFRLRRICSV